MSQDISSLRSKVEELEKRIGLPQKERLGKIAAESGQTRKNALQLQDSDKSKALTAQIAALADNSNVVVEWSARELAGSALAAVRCCCCCCCCVVVAGW